MFVSHRWGRDNAFRAKVTRSLADSGLNVEDLSLAEEERIAGPRNGRVPDVQIKQEISDRISRSDVVIVPAEKLHSTDNWIGWELDTAAIQRKPILFLTEDPKRQRFNGRYRQYKRSGLLVDRATTDPVEIVRKVRAMMAGRHH